MIVLVPTLPELNMTASQVKVLTRKLKTRWSVDSCSFESLFSPEHTAAEYCSQLTSIDHLDFEELYGNAVKEFGDMVDYFKLIDFIGDWLINRLFDGKAKDVYDILVETGMLEEKI